MKWILLLLASMVFITGFISFWLPVPVGLPLMLISLPVLMKSSRRIRKIVRSLTRLNPRLDKLFHFLDKDKK